MKSIVYLVPMWVSATLWLFFLSRIAPKIEDDNERELHFPRDLEDLKNLAVLLKLYNQRNVYYTTLLFSSAYIYKQTFVIPGSVFLNLLGGALYGLLAFPLVVLLTGVGATLCYTWSHYFGRDLIEGYFPHKLEQLQEKIKENEHQLLYYILFLRLFPVSPNWLINVASPIIGVPISTFFISAVVGLAPYNFLTVQAGQILGSLNNVEDLFTFTNMLKMALMACVALIPSFFMKKRVRVKQH